MDTAGSYDFPAMLRLCINKANAFVIVFSHDNLDSLIQAGQLLAQIKSQRKDYAPLTSNTLTEQYDDCIFNINVAAPPIVVVCNKSDLPNSYSQVSEGTIMEWLLTNGLKPSQFVYASAKTNDSVMSVFESLWLQNSVSKAIKLVRWDGVRRASLSNSQQITSSTSFISSSSSNIMSANLGNMSSSGPKETDFSALSGTVSSSNNSNTNTSLNVNNYNNSESSDINQNEQKSSATKLRQGIFRNSLRLSRKSSGKTSKCKPDIVHLDCVIS
ncbi:unnamed protein product [Heterobilharzia americana]|nr:unnamed protein product [Heterobilharzia americana]